ncbi:MAG TPA: D-alanine--poly(phosphoribitol) ligase subunit 2 [Symbiobacteriaceae bacterium]|nr:D-alanine--poly(phosphoribitol) ligase subunit 2 [Symbiobacteriaceae bacterium]
MTILERVTDVIARIAGDEEPRRNPEVHLYETGLIDSFGTVELMLALEQEFGTAFSPAEFDPEAWATPAKIAEIVGERAGQ